MSESRFTFKCATCDHPILIDRDNPPNDEDVITCGGCGHVFGAFGVIRVAMVDAAKAELEKIITDKLGRKRR